jgi:hypothetical protein
MPRGVIIHLYQPKEDTLVRRHKNAVIDLMIRDHPIRSRLNPPNTHHLTDGNSRVGHLPLIVRQHLAQAPPDSLGSKPSQQPTHTWHLLRLLQKHHLLRDIDIRASQRIDVHARCQFARIELHSINSR